MNAADLLTAEISREHGLKAQPDWRPAVEAALATVAAGVGPSAVLLDPAMRRRALSEVIRKITVPETHFFRNSAQLEFAAQHASSVWSNEGRVARIWCAGSASGEEPYTFAMLLHRGLGARLADKVEITGSDLNPDVVERARRAIYTAWSFRGAPSWCLQYFERIGKGELLLAAREVKDAVEFTAESCQVGVLRQAEHSLDVVSFRNVAIYMEQAAIDSLHRAFASLLCPDGLLLLGPSDPRPTGNDFELLGYRDHAPVFRRRQSAEMAPAEPPVRMVADAPLVVRDMDELEGLSCRSASTLPPPVTLCGTALTDQAQLDPSAQLRLLGLSLMEKGDANEAVAAFRQALFLEPQDLLARYFYALSLKESADDALALRQLLTVKRELEQREAEERLSDGSTRVGELRVSAEFMRSQWS
jgi:chemotaxis methyl-accepting protein methylase